MKQLLLSVALILTLTQSAFSSHLAAGEVTYRYIGDSTGIPHQYEVKLKLLRYAPGASLGLTATIDISSSCYQTQSISLQRYGSPYLTARGSQNCMDQPGFGNYQLYLYKGSTILPGKCSDFRFSYSLCCRPAYVSNIQNPTTYDVYFYSELDNTNGSNSSPIFFENLVNWYCLGKPSHSFNFAKDPDNDSLYYELVHTYADDSTSIPFITNHSVTSPIQSSSPFQFDNITGSFSFTPSLVEQSQVTLSIKEYKLSSQSNQYLLVGQTIRDLSYIISGLCDSTSLEWTQWKDTLNFHLSLKPECNDTMLEFYSYHLIPTLAIDGTDFIILDSLNNTIQIDSARPTSIYMETAKHVQLYLSQPLFYDDLYRIISTKGNDGNTLMNACGYYLKENDTAFFRVSDCGTKLSIMENGHTKVNIYPSPAQDFVTVSLPLNKTFSAETISIHNLQGQVLYSNTVEGVKNPKIDVQGFSNGIYTLTIRDSQNQVSTSKFVISR